MFDGDGFGVGLTVAPLDVGVPPEPGRRPSRLTEVLPPGGRSRAGVALELRRMQGLEARIAAYKASLVVELADTADGSPDAQEFFVDELAVTLGTSLTSAGSTLLSSETLVRQLPGTWAARADG